MIVISSSSASGSEPSSELAAVDRESAQDPQRAGFQCYGLTRLVYPLLVYT